MAVCYSHYSVLLLEWRTCKIYSRENDYTENDYSLSFLYYEHMWNVFRAYIQKQKIYIYKEIQKASLKLTTWQIGSEIFVNGLIIKLTTNYLYFLDLLSFSIEIHYFVPSYQSSSLPLSIWQKRNVLSIVRRKRVRFATNFVSYWSSLSHMDANNT